MPTEVAAYPAGLVLCAAPLFVFPQLATVLPRRNRPEALPASIETAVEEQ